MQVKSTSVISLAPESSGLSRKWRDSLPVTVCFAVPAIVLLGAYVHMAIFYKKLWLFDTVVHERGKYTVLEVIFYFRHFLWEVLIKLVYSVFVVGAFYYYGNPLVRFARSRVSNIPPKRVFLSGIFVLGFVLFSILMTGRDVGFKEAMMGLMQYRTHELRPLVFGSHWRNHFLSNIVLFSTSVGFILLYRMLSCGGIWNKRRFSSLLPVSSVIFIVLTFFFGFTLDPFQTPSYLGHQLREIFGTDLSVTLFLSMGVLIYLEKRYDIGQIPTEAKVIENRNRNFIRFFAWLFPAVLLSGFLIIKVLTLDIGAQIGRLGNTKNWSILDLFAWHFFEHTLDYIFVVSVVYFLYLFTLRSEYNRIKN